MNDKFEFELPSYENQTDHFSNHSIAKSIGKFLDAGNDIIYGANVFVPVAEKMKIDKLKKAATKQASCKKILAESDDLVEKAKANADLLSITRELQRMHNSRSSELLAKSVFIGLFSEFDSFIGSFISAIYEKKSDLFSYIGKEITIGDLRQYETLEALRTDMLYKEIESIKRESYIRQFEIIENKAKIELRKFAEWPNFVEVSQRRNLLTHADGIVSEQYLHVCKSNNCKNLPGTGEKLKVTPKYIIESAELLMLIALMLGQTVWRKILPEESLIAGQHLNEVIFDAICSGKFSLAIRYSEFGMSHPVIKQASNIEKRVRIINYALSHKLKGNENDCLAVLEKEDWSDALRDFALAVAVLKNDFSSAAAIMKKIGQQGELIDQGAYATWPLFYKFRQSEVFLSAYIEIYGHPFCREDVVSCTVENANTLNTIESNKLSNKSKKGKGKGKEKDENRA